MATETVTTRDDGRTIERIVERDNPEVYVDDGGRGIGGILVGIALLALVAIVAAFLISNGRNRAFTTNAIPSAAASVADSAAKTDQAATEAGREAASTIR